MRDAFICEGVRTPVGRYGGGLSSVRCWRVTRSSIWSA